MPDKVTAFEAPAVNNAEHGGNVSAFVLQPESVLVFDGDKEVIDGQWMPNGRQSIERPIAGSAFRDRFQKFSNDAYAVEVD